MPTRKDEPPTRKKPGPPKKVPLKHQPHLQTPRAEDVVDPALMDDSLITVPEVPGPSVKPPSNYVPTEPVPVVWRTRNEIRRSAARAWDTLVRPRLEKMLVDETTPHSVFLEVSRQLKDLGVGNVSTSTIDPEEVASLPAPVFVTQSPDAPLPDGK